MLKNIFIFISLLFLIASHTLLGQSTWLWAESIDKNNLWNEPFYKPLNSVDNLVVYRTDSTNFCMDCSLPTALWTGIESGKIAIWQLSKKSVLIPQKYTTVKSQLLVQIAKTSSIESIQEALTSSEITIYRRPLTETVLTLAELPIEWIGIKFPFEKDTTTLYLKAVQCLSYLKTRTCNWVLPSNHHTKLNMADALIQRRYIVSPLTHVVTTTNLQTSLALKKNPPTLFKKLQENNRVPLYFPQTENLYIRLQAMYSASITSTYNRGLNKSHIIDYLLKLHAEQKITAYRYHPAGYFTKINKKEINAHLLVETVEEGEYVAKRYSTEAFTQIHLLKTLTKISNEERISSDWFIIGMDSKLSSNVYNTHAVAFQYTDVVAAIHSTNMMWYSGTNEIDSMRLDIALQKEYIDFNTLVLSNLYGDTITSIRKDSTWLEQKNEQDPLPILYSYGSALVKLFKENPPNTSVSTNKTPTNTYYLTYHFPSENESLSSQNSTIIVALIDAVEHKKIKVYRDPQLKYITRHETVLNKLDKAHFYKTGNLKKDSIFNSRIPLDERYIKPSELTDLEIVSTFSINNKKSQNAGFSFGVFIPAEINPQYESDTLCYVSYGDFLAFLQKNKTYKKLSPTFKTLLNDRAIISVKDFYDLLIYDASNDNTIGTVDMPEFIRARCIVHPED